MKNVKIIAIVLIVVALGAGFFAGMKYQQSKIVSGSGLFGQGATQGQRGAGRRFGSANGGAPVDGQIVSQDASSITIQMQDGSQKIVDITSSTIISKTSTGSATDLKKGERVAAFGTTNSDGSITAQNIQLNPMRNGGRGGAALP
jgi:hypothetical protein